VEIFLRTDSYIWLITSYLLAYQEDRQDERYYTNSDSIQSQRELLFKQHDGFLWPFPDEIVNFVL